MLLERLSVGD